MTGSITAGVLSRLMASGRLPYLREIFLRFKKQPRDEEAPAGRDCVVG